MDLPAFCCNQLECVTFGLLHLVVLLVKGPFIPFSSLDFLLLERAVPGEAGPGERGLALV